MNTHDIDIELPPLPTIDVMGKTLPQIWFTAAEVDALRRAAIEADRKRRQLEAEEVCAEAYQVVGSLLSDLGIFETHHAEKILDNLSQAKMVHDDVLPWPSFDRKRRGEPVAYRLLRKNADGEWVTDGRPWCDGVPDADLVKDSEKSGQYRIEYAFADPQPAEPVNPRASSLAEIWRINADEAEAYGRQDVADTLRGCADEVETFDAPPPTETSKCEPVAWHSKQYGVVWMAIKPGNLVAGTQWFIQGRQAPVAEVVSPGSLVWHIPTSELEHGTVFFTTPQPAEPVNGPSDHYEQIAGVRTRRVYHGTPEHEDYIKTCFNGCPGSSGRIHFLWDRGIWSYLRTVSDETGVYELLVSPDPRPTGAAHE